MLSCRVQFVWNVSNRGYHCLETTNGVQSGRDFIERVRRLEGQRECEDGSNWCAPENLEVYTKKIPEELDTPAEALLTKVATDHPCQPKDALEVSTTPVSIVASEASLNHDFSLF
jgi:hypothetical protein